MPVVKESSKSMALLPVGEASRTTVDAPHFTETPRQPTSLQGLLRFSMDATRLEDAPHRSELGPMDEERKKFLESALNSMTMDLVALLQEQIKVLRVVNHITEDDLPKCLNSIETILDYIDNIDIANDFHKIGGFTVLFPCLRSAYSKIRAGGCELIAVLCQNNPYCQKIIIENEFIPMLIKLADEDEDVTVIIKAIYALGGIIRENKEGIQQFIKYNGLPVMLKRLKGNSDTAIIKSCFLLSGLCRYYPEIKDQLIELEFIPQLLTLFMMNRCPSHEFVLSLLVSIMEDRPRAVQQCLSFQYNVKEILQRYMNAVKNKEYVEEEEYCRRILHMLNSEG